jgi:hypothetical protein
MYTCDLCDKTFTTKQNFHRHIERLNPCNLKKTNKCKWCDKLFSDSSNCARHEKDSCPVKQQQSMNSEMAEKVRLLELKIIELKEMVDNGINPIASTQSSSINGNQNQNNHLNTTTTNTNSNNINITINKYGYETLTHISPKKMTAIFRKCYESIPAFIMLKHFDKSAPQNRNVYIADLKSKYALTYDGNRWNITDRNDLLDEMYNENLYYLEGKYEENYEDLDDTTATKFRTFLDSKDDDSTVKMVKDNIRKMLYNERNR